MTSQTLSRAIVTFGYVGCLPRAPGTWGSAAAIPLAWLLHGLGGFWLLVAGTLALLAVGYWASAAYLGGRSDDPSEVVIDEVVGMLVTLWPLSFSLMQAGSDPWVFPWPAWALGFALFRAFDILKPPPIRWLDRPGAFGIMADDVAAGIAAAALVFIAGSLAHG